MTTTTIEELRVCEWCFQAKPLTEFRCKKRGTDLRARECNRCHCESERLRKADKREQQIDRKFAQFHAQLKRTRDEQRVALLVSVMVAEFGGMSEFVGAWVQHVHRAMERRPGSKMVLDFFGALLQLSHAANQFDKPPDPSEMTTEELAFAIQQQVREMVRDEPEIAVAALEAAGWTVSPPAEAA